MPDWLAELTPTLFDGVPSDQANAYALRYAAVAERWCALTPEAWDRVSVAFRIACIEQALASAESVQPTPRPAYWDAVQSACTNMVAALKSGDAADAAEAARAVAREAELVAREAEAAFWTATKAAKAGFAKAMAYARLFDALLDAINAEIGGVCLP